MILILFLLVLTISLQAQTLPIKFGGFIDTYYAYDFNNPANHERKYTTQPARHNEFNVNLAYIDATIKQDKTRGRLALQFGNSVFKNTSAEQQKGTTSGQQSMKEFQEAFVGTKVGEKTWVDAGIFMGNIGSESWISKENWTYTRSLNLDYVPYYSSGVRLEHQLSEKESFQIQVLNGWQNVSENNQGKAIGMQYKNQISNALHFTYNNFAGDEEVVKNERTDKFNPRFRAYHNFIFQYHFSDLWQFLGAFDAGHQSQQNNKGVDGWFNCTFTARRILNEKEAVAFRGEYYNDRHEANVSTGTPNGFQVIGASANYDLKLEENALWRMELRGFKSEDSIYPAGTGHKNKYNGVFTTSLSLWF